jgi:hypothetical protein
LTNKKYDDEPIAVRIDLPLPTDVVSTLIKIVGLTYPRTMISDDHHTWKDDHHTWKHERQLVLKLDPRDRHKNAKAMREYRKLRDNADGWVGWTTEVGPNGIGIGPHELLAKMWVEMARESLKKFEAPNYIESKVYDPDDHTDYTFYVARSHEQTPHELRMEAEKRAEKAETRVAELEAELAQLKEGK